jgi:hypothetical protein
MENGSLDIGVDNLAGRVCDSVEDANAYLMESFQQMFPEHVCSEQCREELD